MSRTSLPGAEDRKLYLPNLVTTHDGEFRAGQAIYLRIGEQLHAVLSCATPITYRTRTPRVYAPMKQAIAARAATVVIRNAVYFGNANEADGA
jgi:hypothetical protein